MRSTLIPCLVVLLAGCPPWIKPADHEHGGGAIGPLSDDLPGAIEACEGDPGGTAYLLGELEIDSDEVSGFEQIAIFANTELITDGGADCVHTFDAEGAVVSDAGGTRLELIDWWNASLSDCSRDDYYVPDETDQVWVLDPYADGPVQLLSQTGNPVALGTLEDGWLEYASAGFCIRRQQVPSSTLTE